MLSVDFWLEKLKTEDTEQIIRGIQQDVLVSCRIIAMQKWKLNQNGQWREACLSLVRSIKTLEGYQPPEDGDENG